jgi:hypothetical protein
MTDNKLSRQEIHPGLGITEDVDQLLHDLMSIADKHLADVNQDLAPNIERKQGKGTYDLVRRQSHTVGFLRQTRTATPRKRIGNLPRGSCTNDGYASYARRLA